MQLLNEALGMDDISPVMTRAKHGKSLAEHKQTENKTKMFKVRVNLAVKTSTENISMTQGDTHDHSLDS